MLPAGSHYPTGGPRMSSGLRNRNAQVTAQKSLHLRAGYGYECGSGRHLPHTCEDLNLEPQCPEVRREVEVEPSEAG